MSWLGLTANYNAREHAAMRELRKAGASRDELATIHTLVALFGARLTDGHPAAYSVDR